VVKVAVGKVALDCGAQDDMLYRAQGGVDGCGMGIWCPLPSDYGECGK